MLSLNAGPAEKRRSDGSESMNTQEAIDVVKAIETLADYMDMDFSHIAGNICFLDKEKGAKLRKAVDLYNEFIESDITKRGELLGIKITTGENHV